MASSVNFLIVHGAYGNPSENWFPWLAKQLEKFGKAQAPVFPTPEGQSLAAWLKIADHALAGCETGNTVLIGHSSGAILALRMAEKMKQPFKAVFAVSPFDRDLGLPDFDPLNASFVHPAFDWQAIANGAGKLICFAGDNDPYVPLAYPRNIADKTRAELIVVAKGGHLNKAAGYTEFPQLLDKIRQVLNA